MRRQTGRALAGVRRSARDEQRALDLLERLNDEYPNGSLDPALIIELPGGVPMSFQFIPAGSFRMGSRDGFPSEQPAHWVRITSAFLLGTYAVTQEQFAAWAQRHDVAHENCFAGSGKGAHPAESLDWGQAVSFCNWLTQSGLLPEAWSAALPSAAQWEYACRAGTDSDYHSGDGEAALCQVGWFDGNSGFETHPVGEFSTNAWGLYDMHGNVWEWCRDVFDGSIYRHRLSEVTNPVRLPLPDEISDSVDRVVRGGSVVDSARGCRAAYGFGRWPGHRDLSQGFRVCLLPGPSAKQAEAPDSGSA